MSLLFKKILQKIKDLNTEINGKVNKTKFFNGDLNNLKETGFFFADSNTQNNPQVGYAFFFFFNYYSDNYILQQATRATPSNPATQNRQYCEGTWSSWTEA